MVRGSEHSLIRQSVSGVAYLAASRLKELTLSLRVLALDVALWLAVTVLLLMGVNVAAQIAEKVIETAAEMVETSVAALDAERPPREGGHGSWLPAGRQR